MGHSDAGMLTVLGGKKGGGAKGDPAFRKTLKLRDKVCV
jgi:hypothetical protein